MSPKELAVEVVDCGNELENQIQAFLQVTEMYGVVEAVEHSDLGMTIKLQGKKAKYVPYADLNKFMTKVNA